MFDKIWYPAEELVAASRYGLVLFLAPLAIVTLVSIHLSIALTALVLVLRVVICIRGAIIIELDQEEVELTKQVVSKRVRAAGGIITVFSVLVIVMIALARYVASDMSVILSITSLVVLPSFTSVLRFSLKPTLITLSIITVLGTIAGSFHSWKVAMLGTSIMLLFIWPFALESAIKVERILNGDLGAKLPTVS